MNCRKLLVALVALLTLPTTVTLAATQINRTIKFVGTVNLRAAAPASSVAVAPKRLPFLRKPHFGAAPSTAAAPQFPVLSGVPIVGPGTAFHGFSGLDALTSAQAQGFTLEPPDQGLAVSNTQVVEAVNLSLQVFGRDGDSLAGPVALNSFFGGTDPNTHFLSDPRVFYDQDTGRWFITILQFLIDSKGNFAPPDKNLIAVSQTSDATGKYNLFSIDVTDTGFGGCPCFGDQPLVGFNKDGIFISTNQFSFSTFSFQTALIVATDKKRLAAGTPGPVVGFQNLNAGGMPGFSIQPAYTARGTSTSANGGTEFLLSSLNPEGYADNRLVLWALTNTGSLRTNAPTLNLEQKVVVTETYIQTNNAPQKNGPTPLRAYLNAHGGHDPLELISPNDDRMQQVVFAGGRLYGSLSTLVLDPAGGSRDGVAWFAIQPGSAIFPLTASVPAQGYVAVPHQFLIYPSIAVNSSGKGVIAFSLTGPNFFPSMAYTRFTGTATENAVHLAFPGAAPEDGFSGYAEFGGNGVARWGDYSAATVAPDGTFWFAGEYIPNRPRTTYTNWGTAVGALTP